MVVLSLVLSCIANLRNVGILLLYVKFLGWRYEASTMTKQAVFVLQQKLDEWCHHKWAPKLLGIAYEKGKMLFKAYAGKKAPAPPPAQAKAE
jgi:hypothetical protein